MKTNQYHYPLSKRTDELKQSGIRSASSRCHQLGGINLGQGVCDIPVHPNLKKAAANSIDTNHNLYGAYEGLYQLRQSVSEKLHQFNHIDANPDSEILIGHGSTGAYVCAVQTLFNPGDEVILFEPFYGYHKSVLELFGVNIKTTSINLDDFSIDLDHLQSIITNNTKGIVLCTPNNPTGKVFTKQELLAIGDIAKKNQLYVITDEIYEYITYPGFQHISFASLDDFKQFTVTISGFSKTYNMTGWRLGYAAGPQRIIQRMALVHDLVYICAVTPLQHAVLDTFKLDQSYYDNMCKDFLEKRDYMLDKLHAIGFKSITPQGAYYIMADFSQLPFSDDVDAAKQILEKAKVAAVTGRSFYQHPNDGAHSLRFCYALSMDKLQEAMNNLLELSNHGSMV